MSILQKNKNKNNFFLFYTPIFTKHPPQTIYFKTLFNKILFFLHYHLSQTWHTHPTTIIKQLASIINPLNHHHQATNLYRQPTQIPTQPSHHQWNPNTHSTQLPSMKSKYSSNPAIVQQDRHLPLSDHGSSDASMPTMVRQHRTKLTKLWSTPSTSHPRCVKAHDA